MHLNDFVEKRLEASGISLDELRELLIRLRTTTAYLARAQSQTERELYDRFVRVEELIEENTVLVWNRAASRPAIRIRAAVSSRQQHTRDGPGAGAGVRRQPAGAFFRNTKSP